MAVIDVINAFNSALGSDPRVNTFITLAQSRVNYNVWGQVNGDTATALLAMHLMTLSANAGQPGSITQQKVGDLSVSYSSSKSDDSLDQTTYGREFKAMRRALPVTPLML